MKKKATNLWNEPLHKRALELAKNLVGHNRVPLLSKAPMPVAHNDEEKMCILAHAVVQNETTLEVLNKALWPESGNKLNDPVEAAKTLAADYGLALRKLEECRKNSKP
jgi:hypothetical protein